MVLVLCTPLLAVVSVCLQSWSVASGMPFTRAGEQTLSRLVTESLSKLLKSLALQGAFCYRENGAKSPLGLKILADWMEVWKTSQSNAA